MLCSCPSFALEQDHPAPYAVAAAAVVDVVVVVVAHVVVVAVVDRSYRHCVDSVTGQLLHLKLRALDGSSRSLSGRSRQLSRKRRKQNLI